MHRHSESVVGAFIFFIATFALGFTMLATRDKGVRVPAAISDWTQSDFDHATLAVSNLQIQNLTPVVGRSYFDEIFSAGDQYVIPYPFNQFLNKLSDYTGQKVGQSDMSGIKAVLFPLGRSLQRNAAASGSNQNFSYEPFFRYPRVVVGIDEDSGFDHSLTLNLKNKFFVGFHEKAQILELISYNEEEGRFEFQIVKDYAQGKKPTVSYANRSLCLSCHQNQAPLFSGAPWSESNANPAVADQLKFTMDHFYGKIQCVSGNQQDYCSTKENTYYFGVPLRVEQSVLSKLDAATDQANLTQVYQRMWKQLCKSSACKLNFLKAMIITRLTGQNSMAATPDLLAQLTKFETEFKIYFPGGLSIPNPNIPNRDPMKNLILNVNEIPKIANELEPLLQRRPIDILLNSGFDATNTNFLIRGLSEEFTTSDILIIDRWLKSKGAAKRTVTELNSNCKIETQGGGLGISCKGTGKESFELEGFLNLVKKGEPARGSLANVNFNSKVMTCNSGSISCLQYSNLVGSYTAKKDDRAILSLQRKNGQSLRSLEGYEVGEIAIDLKNQTSKLSVYDQNKNLDSLIEDHSDQIFKTESFSRYQIMSSFMDSMGLQLPRPQRTVLAQVPLTQATDSLPFSLVEPVTGFSIVKNVCTRCHQNNEMVPANFMGTLVNPLTEYEQCRRIEQCAPRMIYRLKMQNCDEVNRQSKKNPMPPQNFFTNETSATATWKNLYNPKIIDYLVSLVNPSELSIAFVSRGFSQAEASSSVRDVLDSACPESASTIYDLLPKCEFTQLKPMTRCR